MVIINTIDDKYFSLDGISYARIYQPLTQGSAAIGIFNKFDTSQQLVNSTNYDEYQINGVTFSNQEDTISELLTAVYSTISESEFESLEYRVETNENKITNLEENQITGVVVYQTKALMEAQSTPQENVSYKVANDPAESNNGYYTYNGATFDKDNDPTSNLEAQVNQNTLQLSEINSYKESSISAGYGQKYIDENGDLTTGTSYTTREYDVVAGDIFKIAGNNRGSGTIACYATYSGAISAANLISIIKISDRQDPVDSNIPVTLDEVIEIPTNAVKIALVSVSAENPQLLLYESITVSDFQGLANSETTPIEDYKTDYVASDANTYTNFGGLEIFENESASLVYNKNWSKINLPFKKEEFDEVRINTGYGQKYINASGELGTNASYTTREYNVVEDDVFKISGKNRGDSSTACYALYSGDISAANLVSIVLVTDRQETPSSSVSVYLNEFVKIPSGVVKIALVSVSAESPQLLLYRSKSAILIGTLGDSLTMGNSNFGWYQDTLRALLGNGHYIENLGVGGEKTSTIMARAGSVGVIFPNEFILPADGSYVDVADGTTNEFMTSTYNGENITPLMQGSSDDSGQRERVVNPCYLNGIECTMQRVQVGASPVVPTDLKWQIKRNDVVTDDITFPQKEPIFFNTGKILGGSGIVIIWMGTNGSYTDFNDLLEQQKIAVNQFTTNKYVVIGLHKLNQTDGDTYEGLMREEFGNKFFNIREYAATNMIYDAGITPTAQDLIDMGNGLCPQSLLYDGTHFLPASNVAIGAKLYGIINQLGYLR